MTPPRTPDDQRPERAGGARRPHQPPTGYRQPPGYGESIGYRENRPAARRGGPAEGAGLRGVVAVLGIFALTLVAAAADSFIGVGLGMITLIALLVSTVAAGLLVRRRDLLSVVIAPPLVFVCVALANTVLAPSISFSLATLATLLIRGFPTMALGFGAALLVALARVVARR